MHVNAHAEVTCRKAYLSLSLPPSPDTHTHTHMYARMHTQTYESVAEGHCSNVFEGAFCEHPSLLMKLNKYTKMKGPHKWKSHTIPSIDHNKLLT